METEVTAQAAGPLSQLDAEDYLELLQALVRELDRSTEAIVTRALSTFEESLHRQRALCARLAESPARTVFRATYISGSNEAPVDAELASRITAASATLLSLNDRYSALLKHSGDTMRLFAGLFRSYSGPPQQANAARTDLHTWSCEL